MAVIFIHLNVHKCRVFYLWHTLVYLFVFLFKNNSFLVQLVLIFLPAALGKPGACPKPTGFGICVEACSGDGDCPDNEKCCSNGCGHVCMKPGT